ncbi:MAG: protein kinase domain-containing protein [Planctomycetota bacterium]
MESLLAHSDGGTSRIHLRPDDEPELTITERGPVSEGPGSRIGPYKILQQIGEGGFGVVYMAEQEAPVQRRVALKIIKLGMDTRQVIARFEAERQALAMMDHPNIARVLEAGATETGRPYFVMELVKGIPIVEYCNRSKLSTRQRLDLFLDVCHAVQHAHQKGVIHRDLKPSNVLVTLHDTRAVPKVIDFGIAKATSHRLTEKTLFTEFRYFIGTPEYMSPDQAEISGLDVDARTDIYSLGVLLYELLTGTTPFDSVTLRQAGYGEIQRIIREVEPPKPSTRLDTLLQQGSDTAQQQRAEPGTLSRLMRGDLDWIVMKAMEKDRTRRYQSASEFSADIGRYLTGQPVLAGPPSVVYRFRKFVQRHRLGVTAAVLITAALVVGLSLATVGLVQARQEAARIKAVNDFLQQLTTSFEIDPAGGEMSVGEIIERGRELLGDDHAVVASLLMTRAASLSTVGRPDEAVEAQREALGLYRTANQGDHPSTAAALSSLGKVLTERHDFAEAEETRREALNMKRRIYGAESKVTADELSELKALLVETGNRERNAEIKDLWYETLAAYEAAVGPEYRKTVIERCTLGKWLQDNGFSAEAEPMLEQGVEQARRVLGNADLTLFLAVHSLAQIRYIRQDIEGVIPLVEELIEITNNAWGAGHPTALTLAAQLIGFKYATDDVQGAEQQLLEFLRTRKEFATRSDLTLVILEERLFAQLRQWFDEHRETGRDLVLQLVGDAGQVIGLETEQYAEVLTDSGTWLYSHGFEAEAEPLYQDLVSLRRRADPVEPLNLAYALVLLGDRKIHLDKPVEAEPIVRESLELRRDALPEGSWLIGSTESILGESLTMQERFEEAEPLLRSGCTIMATDPEAPDRNKREGVERLAKLYDAWARPEQAAEFKAKLLLGTPIDADCCNEQRPQE